MPTSFPLHLEKRMCGRISGGIRDAGPTIPDPVSERGPPFTGSAHREPVPPAER